MDTIFFLEMVFRRHVESFHSILAEDVPSLAKVELGPIREGHVDQGVLAFRALILEQAGITGILRVLAPRKMIRV
jgi:hypothetical protein